MIKTSRPSQVGVHNCDGIARITTITRFKAIVIIASVVYTVNRIILK